jgi:hypothetical protein
MLRDQESFRFLGWTESQWAVAAGQIQYGSSLPAVDYQPTAESALQLRRDWMNSMETVDFSKRDDEFAHALFLNVAHDNARKSVCC